MNGTFRQSMAWLHTWAGLVVGWVLYFMFVTGSLGYFDDEITGWMQPEVPVIDRSVSQATMLEKAEQRLNEVAPNAPSWFVDFPVGRYPSLSIWWQNPKDEKTGEEGEWQDEALDLKTGQPITARKTGGGGALYVMHYVLHYMPNVIAYWITSLCAMFMLVALITGIVIHKKIFKDFFTFRPRKGQRSWLDMHNVMSVLPLPFHLMITYSGLIYLMFTTMPAVMNASYGVGEEKLKPFYEAVFEQGDHKEAQGVKADMVSLTAILAKAESRWGKDQLSYIGVENRGDVNAHVELAKHGSSGLMGNEELVFDGVSGDLQHSSSDDKKSSGSKQFYDVMTSLHEGLFASTFLRWLYFISGLLGAGMIATGMILWASKRRLKADKKGLANKGLVLVERLNLGTIVGLPIAIAVYFWANRLVPVDWAGRESWEINALFITWAMTLLYPIFRSLKQAWVELLSLAAVLTILLPVLNYFTSERHLGTSLAQSDWVMAGFDLTMLLVGIVFALTARYMQRKYANKRVVTERSNSKDKSQTGVKPKTSIEGLNL